LEYPKLSPQKDAAKQFDSVTTLHALAHPVDWHITEMRFGFPEGALQEED
jgi:hypothetical protein